MMSKKLFSAVLATLVILSIVAGSTVAFAQTATPTTNATKNVTKGAVKSAAASKNVTAGVVKSAAASVASAAASKAAGFLGLPGFEAVYGVAGLLAVAYLVMRRRN
ncbi:MAG: PGF-CTERM sorting domain-containing protein [Halobacteriota archaeon]|jgi:PGF-CTERM protein